MKKLLIAAALTLAVTSVSAQERAAGSAASSGAIGGIATSTIVAGAVAVGVVAAIVSNNRSSSVDETELNPTCNGADPLNADGACVGTTNTVTISGTSTVTVPVTFTYAPTLQ